ncbi:MAG: CPBP family glutamic-type intramembrane protease [Chloroflexota bacterium]
MATDFDPYGILQVPASARQEQIDEAYRKQYAAHGSDQAPDIRLREIQAAYRVLSDPAERRLYDERRAHAPAPTAVAERAVPFEGEATVVAPTDTETPLWTTGDIIRAVLSVIAVVIAGSVPIYLLAGQVAGSTDNIDKDGNAIAIVLMSSLLFQAAALGSVWYFGLRKYKLSIRSLGFRPPETGWPWLPFVLVMAAMAIVVVYSLLLDAAGISPDTDLPDAVYDNILPLAIALVLTVAVAPVVEETFFRGFVFAGLSRRFGWVWGALGSGTLFGAAHLGNAGYLYVVPPIIAIGVMFAWAYRKTHSIYTSMAAHFLFNLIQMIAVLAYR